MIYIMRYISARRLWKNVQRGSQLQLGHKCSAIHRALAAEELVQATEVALAKSHKTRKPVSERAPEAKIFMTGRSQAVRLPKEFRLPGESVHINRLGNSIVLTPKSADRWAGLFAALDEFPRDFILERDQTEPERLGLSKLFEKVRE
jgi:antitoxin VapB